MALQRICPRCGATHPQNGRCPKTPKRKDHTTNSPQVAALRTSTAWRKKRETAKQEAHYMCQLCWHEYKLIRNKHLHAHHIIPLEQNPDGLLQDDNLLILCPACHNKADSGLVPVTLQKQLAQQRIQKTRDETHRHTQHSTTHPTKQNPATTTHQK